MERLPCRHCLVFPRFTPSVSSLSFLLMLSIVLTLSFCRVAQAGDPPSNVQFAPVYSTSMTVSWQLSNPSVEQPLRVFTRYSDFSFPISSATGAIGEQTFTYTGLEANVTYYFKVKVSTAPDLEYSLAIATATMAVPPFKPVANWTSITSTSAWFAWGRDANAYATTQYRAEISSVQGFSTIYDSTTSTNTYVTFSSLSPNTSYYFRVKAQGHNGIDSSYTVYPEFVTPPPPSPETAYFDVGAFPPGDSLIYGASAGDKIGTGMTLGDVNGDGFQDLIIGAPQAWGRGGKVYVVFGTSSGLPATFDLLSLDGTNGFTIRGGFEGVMPNFAGIAFSVGDFNGDGKDDVVLAASHASGPNDSRPQCGEVYVVYGRSSFPALIETNNLGGYGMTIYGADPNDFIGIGGAGPSSGNMGTGDFNGDGLADVYFEAAAGDGPNNSRINPGDTYIIFGKTSPPATLDLAALTATDGMVIWDDQSSEIGNGFTAGDFNNDGFTDLVTSAGNYLIYGKSNLPASIDLAALSSSEGAAIIPAETGDGLGSFFQAGDFNGDGVSDLIIAAELGDGPSNTRPDRGEIWIVYGRASLPNPINLATLSSEEATVIYGDGSYNPAYSPAATIDDLNSDGKADLLVGKYLVYGRAQPPVSIDLAALASSDGRIFSGEGFSGAAIGDLDGNGRAELFVGFSAGDGPGDTRTDAGEVYVLNSLLKPPTNVQLVDPTNSSLGLTWTPVPSELGYIVSVSTSSDFGGTIISSQTSDGNSSSLIGSDMTPNTHYFVRVGSLWAGGITSYAPALAATTLASAPSGAAWGTVNTSSITVVWTLDESPANPNDTTYIAQLSTASDFTGILYSAQSVRSAGTVTTVGLGAGTTYYARLIARNREGIDAVASITGTRTTNTASSPAPAAITDLQAYQSGTANTIKLIWTAPGADGETGTLNGNFFIQYSTNASEDNWAIGRAGVIISTTATPGTSQTVKIELPLNAQYYFHIWAEDEFGSYSPADVTAPAANAYNSPFSFEIINADLAFNFTSIAVDRSGNLHAAYKHGVSNDLRYAKWNGSTWAAETVDPSANDVGGFMSIAVDLEGNPYIAYRDVTTYDVWFASWTGTSWARTLIDSAPTAATVHDRTSIAVDALGQIHLAYNVPNVGLHYAKYNGTGWTIQQVDGGAVGGHCSLALNALGQPRISYHDFTNGNLKYAEWIGDTWSLSLVDDGGAGNVGNNTSLVLDGEGYPRIAYYDVTGNVTKYAWQTSGGWNFSVLASSMNISNNHALALDGTGKALFSYYEKNTDIIFATFDGVSWTTGTVDSEGTVGLGSSLAIDPDGNPHILYRTGITSSPLKHAAWTGAGFSPPMGGNSRSRVQAPSNLRAATVNSSTISWVWTDNASNEFGYRLYYSSFGSVNNQFSLAAATTSLGVNAGSFNMTGLTPNTSYQAYVAAVNAGGVVTSSTSLVYTLVSAPSAVWENVYTTSVTVKWFPLVETPANPNYTTYIVQLSTTDDFTGTIYSSQTVRTAEGAMVRDLQSDTTYYGRLIVRGLNGVDTEAPLGTPSIVTLPSSLGIPSLSWGPVYVSSASVTWAFDEIPSNTDTTDYIVKLSTASDFTGIVNSSQTTRLDGTATLMSLQPNTTYYGTLTVSADGDMSTSSASTICTLTNIPSAAAWGSVFATSAIITWGSGEVPANPADTIYIAELSTNSDFSGTIYSSQTVRSVGFTTVTGLQGTTTYYGRLIARNRNGIDTVVALSGTQTTTFATGFSVETFYDPTGYYGGYISATIDRDNSLHVSHSNHDSSGYSLGYWKRSNGTWTGPVNVELNGTEVTNAHPDNSIAIGPSGNPSISFLKPIPHDLKYAGFNGVSWSTQTVDSAGAVGRGNSVAVDAWGRVHVAYLEVATGDDENLKYALFDGSSWTTQTVDAAGEAGFHSSIALDGEGHPHIAYQDKISASIKHAEWDGTNWNLSTVATGVGDGVTTYGRGFIALDGNGEPSIAYSTSIVRVAQRRNGVWNTLPQVEAGTIKNVLLDGNGTPHLVYVAGSTYKYAWFNGIGWTKATAMTATSTYNFADMAMDASGNVHIIASSGSWDEDLRAAHWTGTSFSPPMGGNSRGRVQGPSNFHVTSTNISSVTWAWTDNASNEFGFRLYSSTSGPAGVTLAAATTTINANSVAYTQSGLTPNTSYHAYVAAVNAGGVVTSGVALVYTLANLPNVAWGDVATSSVSVAWTLDESPANPDGTTYIVQLSTASDFTGTIFSAQTIRSVGTATVTSLAPGTVYYGRLLARNGAGVDTVAALPGSVKTTLGPNVPPCVVSVTPSSTIPGIPKTDVLPDTLITVVFDEPMDQTSLAEAFSLRIIRDRNGVPVNRYVEGDLSYSGQTLTFRSHLPLVRNHTFAVTITTRATDLAGEPLCAPVEALFNTIFDPLQDNTFVAHDGRTIVDIPAETFEHEGFIRISTDPANVSLESLSDAIREATRKQTARTGGNGCPLSTTLREFQAVSTGGEVMDDKFRKPVEVVLPYEDQDDDGFAEDGARRIHNRFLGVVTLDERTHRWVRVPGAVLDSGNKSLRVNVNHFSVYAVMPVALNFVGDAYAFPVPYEPKQNHRDITFANLPVEATIRIYTVAGRLVRELQENDGDGEFVWDVRNDDGEALASGVFIYVITSGSETKTGKLAVIR